jgi:WD40 repeat protein
VAWHRLDDFSLVRRIQRAHTRIANACCETGQGHFASVGRDRQLRLWDGPSCEVYDSAHPNSVKCIAIDDTHSVVATGSYGGTLALFDLGTRQWRAITRPTHAGISSIAWDGQARRFLAASYDGQIYPVAA